MADNAAYPQGRCNAESPIYPGDTGPVVCRLEAGHTGAHVATSIEPQDRYYNNERSWNDSPKSVPHRG